MDASEYFRGKRITVMGLGLLGRGVGDVVYLAECGAELIVTDIKTREALAESVAKIEGFKNITLILGGHRLEDFRDRDFILKAAGVSIDSHFIAEAQKNNIPIRMSADLFVEISGIKIIGVTGTRGKSTVSHMIYEILKAAGVPVLLGGNVRGVSNLALLKEVTPEHLVQLRSPQAVVLELDSWQLQGFGSAKISPHLSVFTTFYQDHLNYYAHNKERYLKDKANIFLYQNPEDTLIIGKQCADIIIEKYGSTCGEFYRTTSLTTSSKNTQSKILAKTIIVDEYVLPDAWVLKIPGMHNRYNAALALAAARAYGIADTVSREVLESFKGVPGRLECIAEKNGVKIYNDTTSTTPEASLVALRALQPTTYNLQPKVILILGGADKNLDMSMLISELPKQVKHLILLSGTGTDRILDSLKKTGSHLYGPYNSLQLAVEKAFECAELGDIILFSPAFASFGMFKNEYDRGEQFNAIIKDIGLNKEMGC